MEGQRGDSHLLAQDPDNVVGEGDAKGEEEYEASHEAPRELRWLHGPRLPVAVAGQVPTHCPAQSSCNDTKKLSSMFGFTNFSNRHNQASIQFQAVY